MPKAKKIWEAEVLLVPVKQLQRPAWQELDRQRHPELKEDNMLMRYGSDCDIWKTSDPLEWASWTEADALSAFVRTVFFNIWFLVPQAFVGFDTTCVERTSLGKQHVALRHL